jgi:hypothetical protein
MITLAIAALAAALATALPGLSELQLEHPAFRPPPAWESTIWSPGYAYRSWIRHRDQDLLELADGAVVRVQRPLPERLSLAADVVLFQTAISWNLWIEDLGAQPCRLVEPPAWYADPEPTVLTRIGLVAGRGAALLTVDGAVFDVDRFDVSTTEDWLPGSRLLLLSEGEAINLDCGDDAVELVRLR